MSKASQTMSSRKTRRTDTVAGTAHNREALRSIDIAGTPARAIDLLNRLEHLHRDRTLTALVIRLDRAPGRESLDLSDLPARVSGSMAPPEPVAVQRARILHQILHRLDEMPAATIGLAQGAIDAVGTGLLAACDIVLAARNASFALGGSDGTPMPAVILPFIRRAIGARACRRFMLTGECVDAGHAVSLGLVHEALADADLEARLQAITALLLARAPETHARQKSLLRLCASLDGSITAEACIAGDAAQAGSGERHEDGQPGTAAPPHE